MFSHILIQLGTQAAAGGDNATGQMPDRGGMAVLHWVLMLSAAYDPSVSQSVFTITGKAPTRLVGTFNQEKALVGAFSVTVKLCVIFGNLRLKL